MTNLNAAVQFQIYNIMGKKIDVTLQRITLTPQGDGGKWTRLEEK